MQIIYPPRALTVPSMGPGTYSYSGRPGLYGLGLDTSTFVQATQKKDEKKGSGGAGAYQYFQQGRDEAQPTPARAAAATGPDLGDRVISLLDRDPARRYDWYKSALRQSLSARKFEQGPDELKMLTRGKSFAVSDRILSEIKARRLLSDKEIGDALSQAKKDIANDQYWATPGNVKELLKYNAENKKIVTDMVDHVILGTFQKSGVLGIISRDDYQNGAAAILAAFINVMGNRAAAVAYIWSRAGVRAPGARAGQAFMESSRQKAEQEMLAKQEAERQAKLSEYRKRKAQEEAEAAANKARAQAEADAAMKAAEARAKAEEATRAAVAAEQEKTAAAEAKAAEAARQADEAVAEAARLRALAQQTAPGTVPPPQAAPESVPAAVVTSGGDIVVTSGEMMAPRRPAISTGAVVAGVVALAAIAGGIWWARRRPASPAV